MRKKTTKNRTNWNNVTPFDGIIPERDLWRRIARTGRQAILAATDITPQRDGSPRHRSAPRGHRPRPSFLRPRILEVLPNRGMPGFSAPGWSENRLSVVLCADPGARLPSGAPSREPAGKASGHPGINGKGGHPAGRPRMVSRRLADRRGVLEAALVPQRVHAAVDLQARGLADIALETLRRNCRRALMIRKPSHRSGQGPRRTCPRCRGGA